MNIDYRKDYVELKLKNELNGIARTKHKQELFIAKTIIRLLNNNAYNSIDSFLHDNPNLNTFLEKNHLRTAITHFAPNEPALTNDDFIAIINNIKKIINLKQSMNLNNIKPVQNGGQTFHLLPTGTDEPIIVNSSNISDMNARIKNTQSESTNVNLHTISPEENAENTFNEVANDSGKVDLIPLSDVKVNDLTPEERELFNLAIEYQMNCPREIKINFKDGIFVDGDSIIKPNKKSDLFGRYQKSLTLFNPGREAA